jgi:hypothetical protein
LSAISLCDGVWLCQDDSLFTAYFKNPKSLLGEAVHYALSQRKYLENVYLDGRLELSNNRAERSVKPLVIGRKNWLFVTAIV